MLFMAADYLQRNVGQNRRMPFVVVPFQREPFVFTQENSKFEKPQKTPND